jgi:hypothetical protein
MRRAAIERGATVRRWRATLRFRSVSFARPDPYHRAVNRFRKGPRLAGCGKARCRLCHGDKIARRPTPQEYRAALTAWEEREAAGLPARKPAKP